MLGLFRKKAQSPTIQATIVIIILVFIFWGVGRNDSGKALNAVATVNGETITLRDYQKQYDQTLSGLRDQMGGSIPSGLLDQLNIKKQVLNKLIDTTLLRQGAAKIGLYVSDQELQNAIKKMEAFNDLGAFDVKRYEQILAGSRMTVSQFEEGMRYDLLSAKVLDHLGRFGHLSPATLKDLFNYQYRGTKVDSLAITSEAFKAKVEKSEAKVTAYFDENKAKYQSDPQLKIKYLLFAQADFKEGTTPTDEEVTRFYQDNSARYSLPERRQARHILIKAAAAASAEEKASKRKQIEEIATKIKGGKDFASLAKEFSEDSSANQGGDLGLFARGQMVKPFEDAVFAMKEGQVSDIVETPFGLHLIKLEKIDPAKVQPQDEVKGSIIDQLTAEATKGKAFQAVSDAYEQIIVAGSLAKYADAKGAGPAIVETKLFTQKAPPAELAALPEVVNAAFALNKGDLSSIIESGQGYAIILVEDKVPPAQQELAAVRTKVEEDFVAAESVKLAQAAAEALLAKVKGGAKLAEEAKALGLEVTTTPFISRANNSEAKLPAQIVQDALGLSAHHPVLDKVATENNTFYVITFNTSQEPDQKLFAEKKGELEDKLAGEMKNDLLGAWLDSLRNKAKITTNEQLL